MASTPKLVSVKKKRSNFNLSRINRSSYSPGLIYPVLTEECLPGDIIDLSIDALMKTAPLLGPCMGSFKVMYTKFFCPIRNYEYQLRMNSRRLKTTGQQNVALHNFTVPALGTDATSATASTYKVKKGSLLDHLGFPVGFSNRNRTAARYFNAHPILAYYDIVRNYFCNQQADFIDFYKSPFLFTNVVLDSAKQYQIDRSTLNDIDNVFDTLQRTTTASVNSAFLSSDRFLSAIFEGGLACMPVRPDYFYTLLNSSAFTSISNSTRILSQKFITAGVSSAATYITVDQLRMANKMQRFLELTLLGGSRYADWVRAAFVEEIEDRLEIPVFLGATSTWLNFQDVISHSAALPNDPTNISTTGLGDIGGRGYGEMRGKHTKYHVKEHGYFMVLMTIIPEIDYYQGIRKMWNKLYMNDLFVPQLDGIGFQDVAMSELCAVPGQWTRAGNAGAVASGDMIWNALNDDFIQSDPFNQVIGKQPAWYEYMTAYNELHGDFVDTLRFWTLSRDHLLQQTAEVSGITRSLPSWLPYYWPASFNYLFAVTDVTATNFYIQTSFSLKMKRMISKYIRPSIE
uniref:Major capsid protein n=1 Tax=Dulem virus 200 TaxID=3145677 RepID=A0AAU8B865_9VIRU